MKQGSIAITKKGDPSWLKVEEEREEEGFCVKNWWLSPLSFLRIVAGDVVWETGGGGGGVGISTQSPNAFLSFPPQPRPSPFPILQRTEREIIAWRIKYSLFSLKAHSFRLYAKHTGVQSWAFFWQNTKNKRGIWAKTFGSFLIKDFNPLRYPYETTSNGEKQHTHSTTPPTAS